VRPGRQLRVRGNYAKPLLIGENLLAHGIPAHVELALELVDPFLLGVMRRVTSARNVIDEERLIGRSRVELLHARDRLIGHVGDEVVIGLADPWIYLGVIAEQIRRPLVGFATHEAVEVLKPHPRRPLVERAGYTVLEGGRVVVLAEPRCGITVVPESRADRRLVRRDYRVIARETGGQLRDHTKASRVMVAA